MLGFFAFQFCPEKIISIFGSGVDEYNEFVFGTDEEIKQQLEICLNSQGYWSACSIRVYYNEDTKDFNIESRF